MKLIGLLGGTFNPIHYGHLRAAQELATLLNFDEVRLIPSANPPHKETPKVSAGNRAAMVELAISNNPLFKLDTRELARKGPSYTFDTLISLREELGQQVSLCWIMGSDAFARLNTWHRWRELLDHCHIILVQRPNVENKPKLADELTTFLRENYTEDIEDLSNNPSGYINMQNIMPLDISATRIREAYTLGHSARYLVPYNVIEYIAAHKLYQE
jgi:nicotinate-nucleotide adenylyltransferase